MPVCSARTSGIRLPPELFHEFIPCVHEAPDLCNLMLTCRAFYKITLPFLYRQIYLKTFQAAHQCFTTLMQNEIAALSVQGLEVFHIPTPLEECEFVYDDQYPLLPLFGDVLVRTTNLQRLALDHMVLDETDSYDELESFFQKPYTFRLHSLFYNCRMDVMWSIFAPFVSRQTELRHLSIHSCVPESLLQTINLPKLRSVSIKFSTSMENTLSAFFTHFPHITDVSVTYNDHFIHPQIIPPVEGVLRYASNLTSLSVKLISIGSLGLFPEWLHQAPRSKNLRFLTVLLGDINWVSALDGDWLLSGVNSIPRAILSGLESVYFECNTYPTLELEPWIQGITWSDEVQGTDFYFNNGDDEVILAKRDSGDPKWKCEKVDWSMVPYEHVQGLVQARFFKMGI